MDYRYLTETKNEFNNYLSGILVPHIYHGLKGMVKYSENMFNQIELKKKKGAKIVNPGIIGIFKKTLSGISDLNNHEIEEEYIKIKNNSGCIDWFDNMVRATFKSYVLFLTWDPQTSNSKYSDNSIYESIVIKDFIHKCYIISCNYFKDNPEIFISKNSKKDVFDILKMCIEMSIKKSLPYNQIIQEYLNIKFDKTNDINSKEILNIKSMVLNMMKERKYGSRPEINNLIIDDTGNDEFVDLEDPEYKKVQLENFINQEKIKEQNKLNAELTLSINESNNSKILLNPNTKIIETSIDNNSEQLKNNSKKYKLNNNNIELSDTNNTKSSVIVEQLNNETAKTNNDTSYSLLSRAEMKNKEIKNLIDDPSTSTNTSTSTTINELKSIDIENNKNSHKSNQESLTSDITNSKTSILNILLSPPAIKQQPQDRINEIFDLNNKNFNLEKKNIKVKRDKNIIMSEKFEQAENFYDNMIKF